MEDQALGSEGSPVEQESLSSVRAESSGQFSQSQQQEIIARLQDYGEDVFVVFESGRGREGAIKIKELQDRILGYNRKEKSLEELSRKFIETFEGKEGNLLELDKATIKLGVERRRMYDIINILESLNVVSKIGKNNYQWNGLIQAIKTIRDCQMQNPSFQPDNKKKQKSLEFLAWGFLNLFIHRKPAISLQEATKILLKNVDQNMVRTKIRRLYDIVNVFKSLGLVRKTQLSTRKPGFQWVGTQELQKLILQKNHYKETPPKVQDRNEYDTRQHSHLERSPPIFPFVQKEINMSFSTLDLDNNLSQKLSELNIDEGTNDMQDRFDALGGLTRFYTGKSAFQLVKNTYS